MNEHFCELNATGNWDFTWGSEDIAEIKKGLASIGLREHLEEWLETPSQFFNMESPGFLIENGYVEDIWLMIYEIGTGGGR